MHNAQVAVNYAIFYPLMKPYCALYGRANREKGNAGKETAEEEAEGQHQDTKGHIPKGDPQMWEAVERATAEGTLDELRNRVEGAATRRTKATQTPKKENPKENKASRSKNAVGKTTAGNVRDDGDDSDGGFFE